MRAIGAVLCVGLLATAAMAGPTTAERKSQFEKAMHVIMASTMPKIAEATRDRIIRDYLATAPNKAQAVEPVSNQTWRSSRYADLDEAAERVLEACQLRYAKPCALLALNDEIAAEGGLVVKDMPRLSYAGEFDIEKIPTIRGITKARPDLQNYAGVAGPKAIAIHPWGTLNISTGKANARDAQDQALHECNSDPRRSGYNDGNCFVYAVNNEVIIPERRQIGK
jgi:hypothetical protein